MGICHYCFNCGRCRGEKPKSFIFAKCLCCGHTNEKGVAVCVVCGSSLELVPGETNTVGKELFHMTVSESEDYPKGIEMADENKVEELEKKNLNEVKPNEETGYTITAAPSSSADGVDLKKKGMPKIVPPGQVG